VRFDGGRVIGRALPCHRHVMIKYNYIDLLEMTTLESGNFTDLKYDDGINRVWLSRMTKEDGEPFDHTAYVEEKSSDNLWKLVDFYDADAI